MSVKKVNWRKGEYEVRTTIGVNDKPYVELVKHFEQNGRNCCFTLAYFHKDTDGYVTLRFVGDRPFTEIAEIDINEVWKELFLTQLILEGKDD